MTFVQDLSKTARERGSGWTGARGRGMTGKTEGGMRAIFGICGIFVATAAGADPAPLPFTYAMFEASVPHVDLPACPVDLAGAARFCRVALFNDAFHVFVFSEAGDQPLIGFQDYDADLMAGLFD